MCVYGEKCVCMCVCYFGQDRFCKARRQQDRAFDNNFLTRSGVLTYFWIRIDSIDRYKVDLITITVF